MDGIKLEKWRHAFAKEVGAIKNEYNAFLLPKKFEDIYELKTSETTHTLSLWIDAQNVPQEIQDRLTELLLKTEPEDSL
jgi:hypothetical protein